MCFQRTSTLGADVLSTPACRITELNRLLENRFNVGRDIAESPKLGCTKALKKIKRFPDGSASVALSA